MANGVQSIQIQMRSWSLEPPPPPVDETPVDEPWTRRRLRSVPPLRQLTRGLNTFCSIASTYFCSAIAFSIGCIDANRLNDFTVSDSDCSHDHCTTSPVVLLSCRLEVCGSTRTRGYTRTRPVPAGRLWVGYG